MGYIFTKLIGVADIGEGKGFDTPERAKLEYYKEQSFLINDRIRKSRENIIKNQKALNKLEEQFEDIKLKFCEELIWF